jgi:hypothetical protein
MKCLMPRSLVVALAVLLLAALPIAAQELSDDEVGCMQRSSFVMASAAPRFAKCAIKCAKRVGPFNVAAQCTVFGACGLGVTDPTCRCYLNSLSTVTRTQASRCGDCPECYVNNGNDPNPECGSDADAKASRLVSFLESLLITGTPAVFCNDSQSINGHSLLEHKCQLTTAKALGALAKQHANCLADCRELERAGDVPPGGCEPPVLSNPNAPTTVQNCVLRWQIRAMQQIHGRCATVEGGQTPACHAGYDGADWAATVDGFVDGEDPTFFCSFPSPAFVDE